MSSRQFYLIFGISVITMKMQKLPCLVSGELGKDAWMLFLTFALINIIGIIIAYLLIKKINIQNVLNSKNKPTFNILRNILLIATTVYFLVQAMLVYEHIQSLFANILFDNLSWPIYSLFLLFAVFFLAHRGIENIALNFELYMWIIIVSLGLICILGAGQTDYSVLLPLQTISFGKVLSKLKMFNCWFGDFFLVLYLGIKCRDIKLSKTLLTYIFSMFFMTFLVIEFIGIYDKYAAIESGLISVLSEQSLLDLSIGRVDWFLILFAEIGAILCCAVNLYFANSCLEATFTKCKPIYLEYFNIIILYILDIFLLVDLNAEKYFFCEIMCNFTLAIEIITIVFLIGIVINNSFKQSKQIKLSAQPKRKESLRKSEVKS